MQNEILKRDFERIATVDCIPWENLRGKRVFVTGATGLIGGLFAKTLVYVSEKKGLDIRVVALVRDKVRAMALLPSEIELVEGDVLKPMKIDGPVDFILHAACPTASKFFVDHPDETRRIIVEGTRHALELARAKNARMVFLSTMEVYGLTDSEDVTEDDVATFDSEIPRNSYPASKVEAENLCFSFAKAYGPLVCLARLTQTFGMGVRQDDKRVFAQFADAARTGRNIVLKSAGTTARCYCALEDAISGLLTILTKGMGGCAYNIANPDTFCTIREMAELVALHFSGGRSRVVVDRTGEESCGYLPPFRMKLNVDRLKSLGWKPQYDLIHMYDELLSGWGLNGGPNDGD